MFNEIIVNVHPYEKRIAILEDNRLVELFAEKKEQNILTGNIYKGLVRNVLPGMSAAFVDLGLARTAFLHYRDIEPELLFTHHKVHRNRNQPQNIADILHPGDEIIVQVKKDPLGKKGARITGRISIPGKFLVFIPGNHKIALSRKITSSNEKTRIKTVLGKIKDADVGLIVRTDTVGISEEDFIQEYNGLKKTWNLISKQVKHAKAPYCLFDENDLSYTLTRDLFGSYVDRVVIDDKKLRNLVVSRLKEVNPDLIKRLELYAEDSPIFDAYGIEKEIENIFRSRIDLPSGGNISIHQTEALVTVDVNTGSFIGERSYDETVKQTNLEAALEIARQIRLRDLSGIMVVDFIDMSIEEDKEEVFNALKNSLKRDRATNKIYPFTQLGLIEISRKRTRPSLLLTYSEQCPHCGGTGRLLSRDSVAVKISRWFKRAKYLIKNQPVRLAVHRNVKNFLAENPGVLKDIENKIEIVVDKDLEMDEFRVYQQKDNRELTREYST
ncbi:MAG: Rne/Rng family ribonuclease [Candidatus Cloacimonetes bacterium]|nr:Rne/Rng family ribonuclease [Candidatus Cloacimonadota bacterium]